MDVIEIDNNGGFSVGNKDTQNPLWGILGFIVPLAGLVLFLVWRYERIKDAKYALLGAIIGATIQLALSIVLRIYIIDWMVGHFGLISFVAVQ